MNIAMIVTGVSLTLIAIWVIVTYNSLISLRLKVDNQWSQIDVQLKMRADLVPTLVEAVKGYMKHENETLNQITAARTRYLSANTQNEAMQASADLSQGLGRLLAVSERYPDLKASNNFLQLQDQLAILEKRIADYRQFYNDTVMMYNRQLQVVPSNIIANMFKFRERSFWETDAQDKQLPSVKF